MKKIVFLISLLIFYLMSCTTFALSSPPMLFLFLGGDKNVKAYQNILRNPCISGVQIIYTWKELEPTKDNYDFSKIEENLNFLNSIHKKLFIQLQDRSFQPTQFNVPDYLRKEKNYHGGVALQYDFPGEGKPLSKGWVARVWDPQVQYRFHMLIQKLGASFDGRIYGINLPETAADFCPNKPPLGFTPAKYFYAVIKNISALRKAFNKSIVVQYVNFFPGEWHNDHNYMQRMFNYAIKNHIGIGGPDVIPYRKSHMKNSYYFFHKFKNQISTVAIAIQEGDYSYKKSNTNNGFNFFDFYLFAKNYLGANILFWNIENPFFTKELMPALNFRYFKCQIN